MEDLPAYFLEKLVTVLSQAPKRWLLKSTEHVVLVHKTDRDPEIHLGELLEPADYKKKSSFGWPVKKLGTMQGGLGFDLSRTDK